jgi:hypothetical protein
VRSEARKNIIENDSRRSNVNKPAAGRSAGGAGGSGGTG